MPWPRRSASRAERRGARLLQLVSHCAASLTPGPVPSWRDHPFINYLMAFADAFVFPTAQVACPLMPTSDQ